MIVKSSYFQEIKNEVVANNQFEIVEVNNLRFEYRRITKV